MNVRMGLLRKKPEWTDERFRGYWQNIVIDRLQGSIEFARG